MNEKKDTGLWQKFTGIWEVNKTSTNENTETKESTSRSISSNHTLQGKLNKSDLSEKGHNFDTTEVEIGKLGLHKIPVDKPKTNLESFSNVDGATLTGLKTDLHKKTFFEEITQTKVFSFLKKIGSSAIASENSVVDNSNENIRVSFPKSGQKKDVIKVSVTLIFSGALIICILYGLNKLAEQKEKAEQLAGSKFINSPSTEAPKVEKSIATPVEVNEILESVNYQALGRGLVYNCKGKHWACVDKNNYVKCRKLSKSTTKDCATQGVFPTNENCLDAMKKSTISNVKDCN